MHLYDKVRYQIMISFDIYVNVTFFICVKRGDKRANMSVFFTYNVFGKNCLIGGLRNFSGVAQYTCTCLSHKIAKLA